mmetsp:Transcript_12284/g.14801  ORF Transcript_12284/g.14801 Transcript_12284/m.14801 type:complete len:151 (+) Transcript_12284:63-515(+)|eukprot:CAMPEP_0195258100 /NCGR_PEP_ID=MMETSP0706-20130129/7201_1 /TAXON_ID=33640 /ORGANISM="Asterionellopsis glacialis, Strain CCMP134" /LENGTH=150 /DNA_ID=CAMNT_0040311411 /DNA_START=47 /DNA_END=499 /DNA_ORIENTATION=-
MRSISCMVSAGITIFSLLVASTAAFAPNSQLASKQKLNTPCFMAEEKKGFFGNFFDELDAFVDDATSRRLGAGSAFYGKRKSSFYGKEDKNRKRDPGQADPLEDYQGPSKSGYFQWMPDEEGMLRPVTRRKARNIERNPNFWDRQFADDE